MQTSGGKMGCQGKGNVSNGLQRGKRTGEEWFWRSFLHKDEREDNGSSILDTLRLNEFHGQSSR